VSLIWPLEGCLPLRLGLEIAIWPWALRFDTSPCHPAGRSRPMLLEVIHLAIVHHFRTRPCPTECAKNAMPSEKSDTDPPCADEAIGAHRVYPGRTRVYTSLARRSPTGGRGQRCSLHIPPSSSSLFRLARHCNSPSRQRSSSI